ncbi:pentatricopeptide repeat-containing protein At3g22690-like [Lathyrus oleraceus]|uniref:pentatricopeptide repeat-containing protein At3g22690-like n=1 Tax=Pisum sativum TaxID=3888 RepID=UPI0021CEA060|nr:pentatricopeptide repeat-containing protein At3g22690-like [Pisum sativum]
MGVVSEKFIFPFLLSASSKSVVLSKSVQVDGVVVKMSLEKYLFVAYSLIHFYAECRKVDLGRNVFDKMLERSVVSWSSLINGYNGVEMTEEVVFLFFEMVEAGVEPNPVIIVCAISVCAKSKDHELGKKVCGLMTELGVKPKSTWTSKLEHRMTNGLKYVC